MHTGGMPRVPFSRRTPSRPRSLAGQLFAMQVVIVAAVVAGCAVLAYVNAHSRAEDAARDQVVAAAVAVADSPAVVRAVRSADPSATLQPYAEQVRKDTGVAFVTIMTPEGIRWTHPDESLIGKHFLGHIAQAQRGETFTETYTGTLGPSMRVVTPVRDGGKITALVSVGITVDAISHQVRGQLTALVGVALAALAIGGLGTYVANRRLRRHTHGMAATELSRMYDYHQATLHAVREGLVLLDADRRVALCNDAARELLGLPEDVVGRYVDQLGLPASLTGAMLAAEPRVDEVHLTAERVVVVNTSPVRGGERRGTVVTLRDHTDLQALTGELDSVRGFAEALRSQAHEASNRLHTVVSLIELGRADDAVDFATAELQLAQALTDQVVAAVGEPVLAALLLGKAAEASERGVELTVTEDSSIDDGVLPAELAARDLVTVLGNLIDNAIDAAIDGSAGNGTRPRVEVTARVDGGELLLRVADSGQGVDPATIREVFRRGWTTKSEGHGLGLALVEQAARRAGGTVGLDRAAAGGAEFTVRLPLHLEVRA
ncbi:MAG: two-component system, CitB family, sensor kinase [Streptomyces sp.]|nr:two-component system, CitB family, sensor kinase [Streptomyces sp.]